MNNATSELDKIYELLKQLFLSKNGEDKRKKLEKIEKFYDELGSVNMNQLIKDEKNRKETAVKKDMEHAFSHVG